MILNDTIDFFYKRKRATILILVFVLLYGMITYLLIPKESKPDIQVPVMYVLAPYQGISPEDAERFLVKPLEKTLSTINGLKEMTSYANDGSAAIILEFSAGFNSNKALQDVRAMVDDAVDKLPKDANRPTVHEINLSLEPVLTVVLNGDIDERALLKIAKNMKEKIESIPNVLSVDIGGDREESLEIVINPHLLETYNVPVSEISRIINANNQLIAAGFIRTNGGEYTVKVPSLIEDFKEVMNFPLKTDGKSVVRLKDVAQVKKGYKDKNVIVRVNGKSAVTLDISKKTGTNLISTVATIKGAILENRHLLPPNLEVLYFNDESNRIIDMVVDLENNLIIAVMFVMIVIILSVGIRSSLVISLSIPASFLAGILVLYTMNLTLNIVVLFSLILTVGMIVDDAIVVSEYADRKMIEGETPDNAYSVAAKRMLWPVITSTLVKLLVFLPLLFWPGVVGQFMKFMPITVIAILTSSLVFALFFQPAIGPLFGAPQDVSEEEKEAMEASENGHLENLKGVTKKYYDLLLKVVDKPKQFASIVVGFMVFVYIAFFVFGVGKEFFPDVEPDTATIVIEAPGNLSINQKDEILKDIESKISYLSKEVEIFYTKVGKIKSNMLPDDTIGTITLEFVKWDMRRKAHEILDEVYDKLKSVKGVKIQTLFTRAGPPSLKPIALDFHSDDIKKLDVCIDKFKAALIEIGGFKNIEDSRSPESIEWRVKVNRDIAAKNLISSVDIGNVISLVTNGLKISTYRPSDSTEEVDVVLRYPEETRTLNSLNTLKVVNPNGEAIPISSLAKSYPAKSVDKIKKVDRQIVVSVLSDVEAGYLPDNQLKKIKEWLETNLDEDVSVKFKGDEEDQKETGQFLISAFIVALFLMFVTMLIQFNNYYHTFIIMTAVLLSTVGVLLGLLVTLQPFGIVMCGVGIISLAGVVLNNNILFIDTYQYLRKQGFEIRQSILMAGVQRMRPILLTACTAILGLLPMVFGVTINVFERDISIGAPSSQWWTQLSASIAGGLAFATLLTLFFTPSLLMIGQRFDTKYDKK